MRDIGYSLETAIADIIDNSISAGARNIDIRLDALSDDPALAIIDDGGSMTPDELIAAMRSGSRSPRDERPTDDLGRFGLGMKTASFSQCRCLTVICRRDGVTHAARWDLDFVADANDWLVQVPPASAIEELPFIGRLGEEGTMVLWQKLDRLAEEADANLRKDHVYRRMDEVRLHLELTFHRFLEGNRAFPKVAMEINRTPLKPFDPFNVQHPATQRLREETIRLANGRIRIQPYILPHNSKLPVREWEKYGGELGYARSQGFYLYRAGRLIIHSTWFRLAKQSELTKLARVQIDMPNGMDHDWKVDVKKASAQPPIAVRERLKSIIGGITGESGKVFRGRGRRATSGPSATLWGRRMSQGRIHYEINRAHPLLESFVEQLDETGQREFVSVLQAIERAIPADAIFSDMASSPWDLARPALAEEELISLVVLTARSIRNQGGTAEALKAALKDAEPWRSHWAKAEAVIDRVFSGEFDEAA
ncbi:ATP-binding protein [Mesorhizobium sp. M0040]|uniref:ATP-binding protein n=1 Tax=Mesorhizobium sp. M0040 TaxID=2956855 RepID=UPI00333AF1AD